METEAFIRLPYSTREEWLKKRIKGIGGSDCSAIVGFNPYKTNVDLWNEKMSETHIEIPDNPAMKYGRDTEDAIRTIFQADYDGYLKVTHTNELLVSKEHDFIRASLDGEIEVLEDVKISSYFKNWNKEIKEPAPQPFELKKGMKGVLEIKTTELMSSIHKEKWNNQVPYNYYCQILHYLYVTNYDFAILRALINTEDENGVKTSHTRTYVFMRSMHQDSMGFLINKEIEFWNEYVLKKEQPPLILTM